MTRHQSFLHMRKVTSRLFLRINSMPGLKFESRKGKEGVEEKPSKEDEDHQKITLIPTLGY